METGFESDQHSGPDNSLLSAQSEYYNLHCCRWPMCLIALFISLSVCLTVCLSAHQIAVREGAGVKHSSIESTRKCQPKNDLDMENVLASPSLCLCVCLCVCVSAYVWVGIWWSYSLSLFCAVFCLILFTWPDVSRYHSWHEWTMENQKLVSGRMPVNQFRHAFWKCVHTFAKRKAKL